MSSHDNWTSSFLEEGYMHVPRLIDQDTVQAARAKIDEDLAVNFDASRKLEYENKSFCPAILGSREVMALVKHPQVQQQIGSLLPIQRVHVDDGQIAIRRAGNAATNQPPYPHIDGIPTLHNGVSGSEISPFTMLVGVFLSSVTKEFAGNFTVWPGSHKQIEAYFTERGPVALSEGMPKVSLTTPKQLLCEPGDVVLCHYLLAHAAAVNTSSNDRYAVFFRLTNQDLAHRTGRKYRENRWTHLTQMWTGWRIRPASESPSAR